MSLVATIYEKTMDSALAAIEALPEVCEMVEVRVERFPTVDFGAIRAATRKAIIATHRSGGAPPYEAQSKRWQAAALGAGIDLVDVEWREGVEHVENVEIVAPERTVLSHHDFEGMRDVESIMAAMRARGCAHAKLAATPRNFADNERLLRLLPSDGTFSTVSRVTIIGMGERGLYSRILAPFRGSELAFVAAGAIAAPGQLTLSAAVEIYGRTPTRAEKVFAVVGNPAGHSLSPAIHNRLFREEGIAAAYTIASIERFDEITAAFLSGEPCGLSVTAPFKHDALTFAQEQSADIGENARRALAVNTLVNIDGRIVADNTDVDGFAILLGDLRSRPARAAVIGAGATGRAALVALRNAGIEATVYNRTAGRGDFPLEALPGFKGDLIIDTLPPGVDVPIPPCRTYIEAAYGGPPRPIQADQRIDGLALLHAQAVRQHALFLEG